jgi:hypothetical protein
MEATQEATSPAPDAGLGPIGLFLIKTVIVSAAIVLSAWILLDVLDGFATRRMQQLEQSIRSATSLGGRQFWTKLEGELDKLADGRTDIPPEKKAKLLAQIKAVSDRWRPFLQEATAAIEGEANKDKK